MQKFVRPTRSLRQQWPPRPTKSGELSIVFQSREQVEVQRGRIRRIGCVIKKLEAQVDQFFGCNCSVRRGNVVKLLAAFFLQNVLQLHQQGWVILRVDSLALWKVTNEEDPTLIPKNRVENISSGFLHSELFGAGWAAVPPLHWLLLCLRVIVI